MERSQAVGETQAETETKRHAYGDMEMDWGTARRGPKSGHRMGGTGPGETGKGRTRCTP
jgi:hypothetical protein